MGRSVGDNLTLQIPLPTGSYKTADPRASGKRLVNCMSEVGPQTSPADVKQKTPPAYLRRMPGISPFSSVVTAGDPYWSNVVLLLHCDGVNGSNLFPDSSTRNIPTSAGTGIAVDTSVVKFGSGSLYNPMPYVLTMDPGAGVPSGSALDIMGGDFTVEGWVNNGFSVPQASNISLATINQFQVGAYSYGFDIFLQASTNTVCAVIGLTTGLSAVISGPAAANYNVWTSFALVKSGQTVTVYVNGVPGTPYTIAPNTLGVNIYSNAAAYFGGGYYGPMAGHMDEYRITAGVARYSGPYNVATSAFPSSALAPKPDPVRGMRDMGGVTYTVIGNTLYSMNSGGVLTALGSGISGSGFVRMVDNTACLTILIPGSRMAYTYTTGYGLQPLNDPVFATYGAIDCGFVDSYTVFLSLDGRVFYNDDGQAVSGQGPITFNTGAVFPREFGTDPFAGMSIDHRVVMMYGVRTSEGYTNAGNAVFSPFSSAPDTFMEIGMHPSASWSVAVQDQAPIWVANDLTVRRRDGQTPVRVSNSGIEAILEAEKNNLAGCYALTPTIGGHPLWVLTIPLASRTIVYDTLTTEWFELESLASNLGYWRPLCWYNAVGRQLVGDSLSSQIGYLDAATFTEFGQPMRAVLTTQSVYDAHNRAAHRRLELIVTAGGSTSLTSRANVTLFKSNDSGITYSAASMRSLGVEGARKARAVWFNLGQARDRTYKFAISDPTETFFVDIQAELQPGRW